MTTTPAVSSPATHMHVHTLSIRERRLRALETRLLHRLRATGDAHMRALTLVFTEIAQLVRARECTCERWT